MNWRLNQIQYPIYNLGAGKRIGIWTQGCTLACEGCVNQTLWSKRGGASVSVLDVFNWIAEFGGDFDGVTISGGEPFQQYEPLIAFLHLVKTRTNLDVYCFSGYTLSELDKLFPDKLFYRYVDFLVDGRYVKELHENRNLCGSSNQTIYRIVDGIAFKQDEPVSPPKWSVHLSREKRIYMAGIPKKDELKHLSATLSDAGFAKTFK